MTNPQTVEGWEMETAKVNYWTAQDKQRPSMLLLPRLFIDGNMWCALYGKNVQDGVAGFGTSPDKAMKDFDVSYLTDISKGVLK